MVTETSDGPAECGRELVQHCRDHLARRRVDRGLAHGEAEAGPGHDADPLARPEHDAGPRRRGPHPGFDQCAVGHVGVVAGILAHGSTPVAPVALGENQREGGRLRHPAA